MLSRRSLVSLRAYSVETVRTTKHHEIPFGHDIKVPNFLNEHGSDSSVIVGKQRKPLDFNYYLYNLHKFKKMEDLPKGFGKNQLHDGAKDKQKTDELLTDIKDRFHDIDYSFGYGSKIFSQGGKVDVSNSQIDMIYAVNNTRSWHRQNIELNGGDYSGLKYCGVDTIKKVGELGAGVYFNPFVNVELQTGKSVELKYGVTSIAELKSDLKNWDTLYMAGRLHKPVAVLDNHPQLSILNQYNLTNAVKLALLLHNGTTINEKELYLTIAGFSYMGDPRMKVNGENPDKIKNIVENQFELFQKLYEPVFSYIPHLLKSESTGVNGQVFEIKMSEELIGETLLEMPIKFRNRFFENFPNIEDAITTSPYNAQVSIRDYSYEELRNLQPHNVKSVGLKQRDYIPSDIKYAVSPIVQSIGREFVMSPERIQSLLRTTVESTVASGALVQSLKGVLTAGFVRSYKYAIAKRAKFLQSQKRG